MSNLPPLRIPTSDGGSCRASVLLLARSLEDRAATGEPVKLEPFAARIVARLITQAVMEGV